MLATLRRSFASSSATPFFFNKPGPSSPQALLLEILTAKKNGRLDIIQRVYPKFIEGLKTQRNIQIDSSSIQSLLLFLATTNRYNLVLRVFNDLSVMGIEAGRLEHHALIAAMCKVGKLEKAEKWVTSMASDYGIEPTTIEYNLLLSGYKKLNQFEDLEKVLQFMRTAGLVDVVSYNVLIASLFEQSDGVKSIERVREMMINDGIIADIWTETALLNGFIKLNLLTEARQVKQRLEELLLVAENDGLKRDIAAINSMIKLESAEFGFLAAMKLAENYRDQGYDLNEWTMNTLAKVGISTLTSSIAATNFIEELEQVVGVKADRFTWSLAISELLGKAGIEESLKLYQEARSRNLSPDSSMIQPLLDSLLVIPSLSNWETCKTLYEDLISITKDYRSTPDLSIYLTLLRGCASEIIRDGDFSRVLLKDMKERGIKLESSTVTYHIIALMRSADSFEDAFRAYDVVRALDVEALDITSYNNLLSAFTSLTFPSSFFSSTNASSSKLVEARSAPTTLILEFLSDMRRSSHPATSTTYTILLDYYAKSPAEANAEEAIKHLHSLIKLDINIDPDLALFNSLMNAYNRMNVYPTCFRIFDSIRLNKGMSIDSTSISIYFDACGFEGGKEGKKRALALWNEINLPTTTNSSLLSLKVVESFLESQYRLGNFNLAEEIIFVDLAPGKNITAEFSTFETLLKFSRRNASWERLRQRVKESRPELWQELKNVAEGENRGSKAILKE